ncbi:right-handed parallel beta-helix repeat-containing protein [candidate division WOR-3 bacterium]|nr:right-handed parallel beta-helix repeat-containing protein [candidate division WOR-3 bacterium]
MKDIRKVTLIISTVLVLCALQVEARTIYVPSGGSIDDSLDIASPGDTVLVGKGIFYDRITWPVTDGIVLISEFGPDSTTIDGSNSGRVLYFNQSNITNATKVDGFTITNGYSSYGGGGIRMRYGAEPTIVNNVIKGNVCVYYGAGILVTDSDPVIKENIIENNQVACTSPDTIHYGGGIYCYNSGALIENNTIKGNKIEEHGKGGGITIRESYTKVKNNRIKEDTSISYIGGGIYLYNSADTIIDNVIINNMGNGINAMNSDLCVVKNNRIVSNTAELGGGIYLIDSDADIIGNSIIANFADDDEGGKGGGMYISSCSPLIEDNVIARNIAEEGSSGDGSGGGIFANIVTDILIKRNTIVLNHAEGSSGMGGGMRLNLSQAVVGTTFADRNNIYHNFAADGSNIRSGLFSTCNATHNYWGTSDSAKIDSTLVYVNWYPFETLPLPVEQTISDTGFYSFGEMEMKFSSLTFGRDSIVDVTIYGDSISPHCTGPKHIDKFFDIQGSLTFNADFIFYYTNDEFSTSTITHEDSIDAYRYNGASWLIYSSTVDILENTVTVNSSVFSEWMLADDVSGLGVDESANNKIMRNKLAAYPNPFSTRTTIDIRLQTTDQNQRSSVSGLQSSVCIYDITGRLVRTLPITDNRLPITKVYWNGRDIGGNEVKSGIYFLKVKGYKPLKIIKLR